MEFDNDHEVEHYETEIHYLKNEKIVAIIEKNWIELLPLLENLTVPDVSNNPTELEKWEAEQRKNRIKILSCGLEYGDEDVALCCLQQLLYEECFGITTHPELGSDNGWWKDGSASPTPGGELSHSYPYFKLNDISIEDCAKIDFSGNTLREQIDSIRNNKDKERFVSMVVYLSRPGNDYLSQVSREHLEKILLFKPQVEVPKADDVIAARFMNMAHSLKLFEPAEDLDVLKILGYKQDSGRSKMFVWNRLWKHFGGSLVRPNGTYEDPSNPGVKEEIKKLLRVRLSPDYKDLFKYYSLEGYRQK